MQDHIVKLADKFDFWSENALRVMHSRSTDVTYKRGENILTPLDENKSVYFIASGSVTMRYYGESGEAVTILKKVAGDLFGIKGIFYFKNEKNFYVVASTKVVCWKISRYDFLELLKINYEFTECVIKWATNYTDMIETKMLRSAIFNTYQRLIYTLIENADITGNEGVVKETQQELGNMLSATRQTIAAYLTIMEGNGMVEVKRGNIILKDIEALKDELIS